jgi:hypothetical protein
MWQSTQRAPDLEKITCQLWTVLNHWYVPEEGQEHTRSDHDAGHSSPQLKNTLSRGDLDCSLNHALVSGARVDQLHARLQTVTLSAQKFIDLGKKKRQSRKLRTLIASIGYMTVCSCRAKRYCQRPSSNETAPDREAAEQETHGDTSKGACGHVLRQGKVGRQGFIATRQEGLNQ